MNTDDSRRARRLGLAVGAAAAAAIILAAASPAAAAKRPGCRTTHKSSTSVANDTLTVRGTNGPDRIALRLAPGNPGILQVDFGDDGSAEFSFARNTFSKIEVLLGNGNDRFRIDQVNGAFADEQVTINGGNGKDTLIGGNGAENFIGGNGNDAVDGNGGNDTADLGSGKDTFTWDPGDGSDVIDGGSGTDTLDFNGATTAAGVTEIMSLSPNGERSEFRRNLGNILMDMIRVERLDLDALGGVDMVTINDMSGTGFRQADLDLSLLGDSGGGDGAVDTVTVNGTQNADHIKVTAQGNRVNVRGLQPTTTITGSETQDRLQVNALGGNDVVDVHPAVSALIGVVVDLDGGQL